MVALPALMEDLVRRACASDASVEVIEPSVATVDEFLRQPALCDVDVIITAGTRAAARRTPRALLLGRPTARVLLIEQDAGEGVLVELRPARTTLGLVSPPELLRAIAGDEAHRSAWRALDASQAAG
ncbi:MAG: hypothetical protein IT355_06040 [Gemmatimonadaceae bacterium]|nr:hypothetical protein [Gemmatimonadaceae bacterium]